MANATSQLPPPSDLTSGAKVGIAIAVAVGIVALFTLGLWAWWRRRQKRKMARELVNFNDGGIVNLVDGRRFEKRTGPPEPYDSYSYFGATSSHSTTPSPVYNSPPSLYHQSPSPASYDTYYAAPPAPLPAPPARDAPLPSEPHQVAFPPAAIPALPSVPPPTTTAPDSNAAWSSTARPPWSPPDYEAQSPASNLSLQPDEDFHAVPRRHAQPLTSGDDKGYLAVEPLPAILPEARPQAHAELPDREGYHGWGHEQELPAPRQPPLRRQEPPGGRDIDEQKFLLADMMPIKEQKSRPNISGRPAG